MKPAHLSHHSLRAPAVGAALVSFALLAVLGLGLGMGGCAAPADPASPTGAASGPVDAAAVRASITNPMQRLLVGHWRADKGGAEFYFGAATMVMVDGGKRQDLRYEVNASSEIDRTLRIHVITAAGGHVKDFRFAPDALTLDESLTVTLGGRDVTVGGSWHRIDERTRP